MDTVAKKQRVWCDACKLYTDLGAPFPCGQKYGNNPDLIRQNCGVLGQPWEYYDDTQPIPEDAFEVPKAYKLDDIIPFDPSCEGFVFKTPEASQVGGKHYTDLAIQPMRYSFFNKLDPCQHTIIKYVTRFREKGGVEDLEKAKHCIDLLIAFENELAASAVHV
jgi:hypothetical protein